MESNAAREKTFDGTSEAIKAFEEYDAARRFVRSPDFQKHKAEILETPVARSARLRKQGKATKAKRLNKRKK